MCKPYLSKGEICSFNFRIFQKSKKETTKARHRTNPSTQIKASTNTPRIKLTKVVVTCLIVEIILTRIKDTILPIADKLS